MVVAVAVYVVVFSVVAIAVAGAVAGAFVVFVQKLRGDGTTCV